MYKAVVDGTLCVFEPVTSLSLLSTSVSSGRNLRTEILLKRGQSSCHGRWFLLLTFIISITFQYFTVSLRPTLYRFLLLLVWATLILKQHGWGATIKTVMKHFSVLKLQSSNKLKSIQMNFNKSNVLTYWAFTRTFVYPHTSRAYTTTRIYSRLENDVMYV